MPGELLHMSQSELERLEIVKRIERKELTQCKAADRLNISTRQVRRLLRAYQTHGTKGLGSKHRGKPSNNRFDEVKRTQLAEIIRTHYHGFSPTLAHEKLVAHHDCPCSRETVRGIMIEHQLWQGKTRRYHKVQQSRARRPCMGELVQIDGSPHDWFEGRAPTCCLIVFVDDASSKLLALWFVSQECTQGYFDAIRRHLQQHGRPVAYYHDKHGIFRVNAKEAQTGNGLTQLGHACQELGIESISANSPQAKGRVERVNKTLQDRLVKEMRLAKINTLEQANEWLPTFIEAYNQKFAVKPHSDVDAHRADIPDTQTLELILAHQHQRTLSKQLELSYQNVIYQIQTNSPSYAMRKAVVTVYDNQGRVSILYKGKSLPYKRFDKNNAPSKIVDSKNIHSVIDKTINKTKLKPAAEHPWRNTYMAA